MTPEFLLRRRIALGVSVLLLAAATTLANRVLPGWAYPWCGTVTAVLLVAVAWWAGLKPRDIGLDRHRLGRSALVGLAGAGVVALVFGTALAIPVLRTVFHDGRVGTPDLVQLLWLTLLRIPFGTVLIEEVAFRGVLPALLGAGEKWRWGPVLGAAALFGLWHALPALALPRNAAVHAVFGEVPVEVVQVLAMLAAAGAGVLLHWWRHAGRGVLTTVIIHVATNSGGLALAVAVQSR